MDKKYRKYSNLCLQIFISLSLVAAGYLLHETMTSNESFELKLTGQIVSAVNESNVTKYTMSIHAFGPPSEISFYSDDKLDINSTYTVTFLKNGMWYTCTDATETKF